MGWLDDVGNALAYTSPVTYGIKEGLSRNNRPVNVDAKNDPIPGASLDQQKTSAPGLGDLVNKIYNGNYSAYDSKVNQGYQNLGQPYQDGSDRSNIVGSGTSHLAGGFIDKYYQQAGQLPTEDQVRQFVNANYTPSFAQKLILNQVNPDDINGIADQYIKDNPDVLAGPNAQSAQQRILGLNKQLDAAYNAGKTNYVNAYDQNVYTPAKESAVNDLSGQGLLTQPNSRFTLDKVEANRGRDISSGLNTLESGRATGAVDLGKTIESLLQSQQQIQNQNSQFNKSYRLASDKQDNDLMLQNRSLSLADQIGRLQANGQKNDGMSGAAGGAISGAGAGASFGPLGALAGGVGGGLLGYFSSKKG